MDTNHFFCSFDCIAYVQLGLIDLSGIFSVAQPLSFNPGVNEYREAIKPQY